MVIFREAVYHSAGIILYDPQVNKVLGCHQTEWPFYEWDIPGGNLDLGESPIQAAIRELYEETSLRLSKDEISRIQFLGKYFWKSNNTIEPDKDLSIFFLATSTFRSSTLKCISFFNTKDGRRLPEVDGYKLFSLGDWRGFGKGSVYAKAIKNIN